MVQRRVRMILLLLWTPLNHHSGAGKADFSDTIETDKTDMGIHWQIMLETFNSTVNTLDM